MNRFPKKFRGTISTTTLRELWLGTTVTSLVSGPKWTPEPLKKGDIGIITGYGVHHTPLITPGAKYEHNRIMVDFGHVKGQMSLYQTKLITPKYPSLKKYYRTVDSRYKMHGNLLSGQELNNIKEQILPQQSKLLGTTGPISTHWKFIEEIKPN